MQFLSSNLAIFLRSPANERSECAKRLRFLAPDCSFGMHQKEMVF